jgi:hypothetical protein
MAPLRELKRRSDTEDLLDTTTKTRAVLRVDLVPGAVDQGEVAVTR